MVLLVIGMLSLFLALDIKYTFTFLAESMLITENLKNNFVSRKGILL
ncbi:hypothetical protein ES707_06812 [subsurface metagenome]